MVDVCGGQATPEERVALLVSGVRVEKRRDDPVELRLVDEPLVHSVDADRPAAVDRRHVRRSGGRELAGEPADQAVPAGVLEQRVAAVALTGPPAECVEVDEQHALVPSGQRLEVEAAAPAGQRLADGRRQHVEGAPSWSGRHQASREITRLSIVAGPGSPRCRSGRDVLPSRTALGRPAGAASRLVQGERTRSAVAPHPGSVRDPRQRGDAAADAGRPRRAALAGVARALAHRRVAGGRLDRGRDPRVAGARVQPARRDAARGRACRRRARLARRSDGAARRRALHGGRRRQLRVRPRRPAGRHERAAGAGAHGRVVRRELRPGALRPRRDDLPGARPALRDLPARRRLPLARVAVRAAAQAVALRRLVPATPRRTRCERSRRASSRRTGLPWSRSSATAWSSSPTAAWLSRAEQRDTVAAGPKRKKHDQPRHPTPAVFSEIPAARPALQPRGLPPQSTAVPGTGVRRHTVPFWHAAPSAKEVSSSNYGAWHRPGPCASRGVNQCLAPGFGPRPAA